VVHFDDAHKRVHLPDDRRIVLILRRRYIIWLIAVPIELAWMQLLKFGIHSALSPVAGITGSRPNGAPRGFPVWIRWAHFANLFFLFLLMRSGLSILMDHPRLYWNNGCTRGSEWLRFTPLTVPNDRVWTAKEDARYISPLIALPGYRHTVGMARSWHFTTDCGFIITGAMYIIMLLISGQWPRLVPTSWAIFPYAWQTLVHYATFHFPGIFGAQREWHAREMRSLQPTSRNLARSRGADARAATARLPR
jgi:sulfoxide reductase catalytic subunit YedY